jgi:DTW domain-containing protein YfiP
VEAARCPRCWFVGASCVCAAVETVPTRTRVVIVRHRLERWRSSNTGRLANLVLPNSEIVPYGDDGDVAAQRLPALADGAWLVFPEGAGVECLPPPRTLIVLDATWSQARRMYRKLPAVRGLPVLKLAGGAVAPARLRDSPGDGKVSTIEAIAAALRAVEGAEQAALALERVFAEAVRSAQKLGRRST